MAFKIKKNMEFNLEKDGDALTNVRVGLTWNSSTYQSSRVTFDADLTFAVLEGTGDKKTIFAEDEGYLVYYGNEVTVNGVKTLNSPNMEIVHSGDDRTGKEGEEGEIHLDKFHDDVNEIAIVGTIHKGEQRGQNWSKLQAKLTIENIDNGEVLCEYDLGNDFGEATAIHAASIIRDGKGWKLVAIGQGYHNGLQAFIDLWT